MVKRCLGNEIADCFTKSFATAAGNFGLQLLQRGCIKVQAVIQKREEETPVLPKLVYENFLFRAGSMLYPLGNEGNLIASVVCSFKLQPQVS